MFIEWNSSPGAQRPVHRGTPFYPISFLHVGARAHTRRPIAVAEMFFLMVELWQIRCVVDDESLPTNHQAYTICSSACESVPQAFKPLSLNYCCSSRYMCRYLPTAKNQPKSAAKTLQEGMVRADWTALHFLIRDGLWDSTLNQSVLQQTLDSRWIYICFFSEKVVN